MSSLGNIMIIKAGERVVVRSPITKQLVAGVVMEIFRLDQSQAFFYSRKCEEWQDVRTGDQAFTFKALGETYHSELCVGILGFTDTYIYTR